MEIHYSDNLTPVSPRRSLSRRILRLTLLLVAVVFLLGAGGALYGYHITTPPADFPVDAYVTIEEGSTLSEIVSMLKAENVIRSENALYFSLVFLHDPTSVKASTYRFKEPLSVFAVANRLSAGEFGTDLKRFVHFEGERVSQVARRANEILEDFDEERFLKLAQPEEGKLFPDTYLIPETFSADDLYTLMRENYESRVTPLRPAIDASSFTEHETLTLASIIEREANSRESMRLVSGILQERLKIGMPLQVDAVFEYILDKPGTELTSEDLAVDSPYNTYEYAGLPPGPIGNPGLQAIEAVLEPEPSPYLYYITGNDGNFYYARTYDEHQRNVNRYLR